MSRVTLTSLSPTITLTCLTAKGIPGVTAPHAAQFSVSGPPGPNGLSITWRGDYSATTDYVANDAVAHNGSSYLCEIACTGVEPIETSNWSMMAAAGGELGTVDGGVWTS
jgi:hypothetical protein